MRNAKSKRGFYVSAEAKFMLDIRNKRILNMNIQVLILQSHKSHKILEFLNQDNFIMMFFQNQHSHY
ncbi:unnamed protein product [Paramecium primaurelia]|uniref:Uncharacterized protein n=1 Tax=Paramecium primaurelia TaxID=5886 RepID=A0A8S1LK33_PARPR|nr:unnamed protein product [Paramecium primaurelia]